MNTQENRTWIIQNKIHELKLIISTQDNEDYKFLYKELHSLEHELKSLEDECD
jgi:hypothetical protein